MSNEPSATSLATVVAYETRRRLPGLSKLGTPAVAKSLTPSVSRRLPVVACGGNSRRGPLSPRVAGNAAWGAEARDVETSVGHDHVEHLAIGLAAHEGTEVSGGGGMVRCGEMW